MERIKNEYISGTAHGSCLEIKSEFGHVRRGTVNMLV